MTDYQSIAKQDANILGIDPSVFVAQIQQESGFNPNPPHSSAGAIGIAQFMPGTAQGLGVNPNDPVASLKAAAQYDKNNLNKYHGDYTKMLAAYNAGGGAVDAAVSQYGDHWLEHMPNETQQYVAKITAGSDLSPWFIQQLNKISPTPAIDSAYGAAGQQINNAIAGAFQPFFAALPGFGIKVALFMFALMLLIIGLWVLTRNPVSDSGSAFTNGLNNAARKVGGKHE